MYQQQTAFGNIVGKEEIAHNKQFLLFPQCFLLNQINVSSFVHVFDIISSFAVELKEPKIGILSKKKKKKPVVEVISVTQTNLVLLALNPLFAEYGFIFMWKIYVGNMNGDI